MPKTTKEFRAVRPGNVYPETIAKGEEVEGRLAEIAEQLGALGKRKAKAATENKAVENAPENQAVEATDENKTAEE